MQFADVRPVMFVTVKVVREECFLVNISSKLTSLQPVLQESTCVVASGRPGPAGLTGLSEVRCKLVNQEHSSTMSL